MKRLLLPLLLLPSSVLAGNYLSQEMETLRSDLGSEDPARRELTLRLADLYFDLSIKDDPEYSALKEDRERSLALYGEALKGEDGAAPLSGETRLKVLFQTARLEDKLGRKDKAQSLFKEIYSTSKAPRALLLEAALYLGESHEDRAQLKEAIKYYQEAISLCTSVDTCNFAHYRLGWTFFKETRLEAAIKELELSLWDAKGQLRDQVVNDLISFMSQRQTDGKAELVSVEELIKKSKREGLMAQLAETFYLAGNREAGSFILAAMNRKSPSLHRELRLLEESYGFRRWDEVDKYLRSLNKRGPKDLPVEAEERQEALKLHRRLIVQLDAEAETSHDKVNVLKSTIDLYLSFWPGDELTTRMREGWLKAETDPARKIERLGQWISESQRSAAPEEEVLKLRRTRLSLAQKEGNSEVVLAEAEALAAAVTDPGEAREFTYVRAFELYTKKQGTQAENLFKGLVETSLHSGIVDKWLILSQNLLLDIYNQRKDYSAIAASVERWTSHPTLKERSELKDEFAQMRTIATQAKFEEAVARGDSRESLDYFFSNCRERVLVPQSCENAMVLSVKLKDQAKLVALLEMKNDEAALVNEYELMGRFSDAARLREKQFIKSRPSVADYLKTALLYELGLEFDQRDRVLKSLVSTLKSGAKIEERLEKVLYVTLKEAKLLDAGALSFGWSLSQKLRLAQELSQEKLDERARKLLLSEKSYQGAVWSRTVLEEMQRLDQVQRKVSFYGANSRALFKRRVELLTRLEKEVNSYLSGSDAQTRVYLLGLIRNSQKEFAQEVLATPLPADLDEATLQQVKSALTDMAAPFASSAEAYQKLLTEELARVEDKALAQKLMTNLEAGPDNFAGLIDVNESEVLYTQGLDYGSRKAHLERLAREPGSVEVLTALEKFYEEKGSLRMASYFKERIQLSSLPKETR